MATITINISDENCDKFNEQVGFANINKGIDDEGNPINLEEGDEGYISPIDFFKNQIINNIKNVVRQADIIQAQKTAAIAASANSLDDIN